MPGYPLPILEYCCTISNRLFGNKTRCTLHDIKPFLPAYLRTYAESALEQREIEHYRFHPLHLPTFREIFQKSFSFFLSLSPFQFFSNLSSLIRKKQSRNRFRSVKINRCSKRAFQNTNEGGKRFETTGFERRERRTGRRFEPIVEWNLSGSLMNEIVHRSRSPPLRLVFIFSFFFHASHSIDPCRLLQSPFPRGRPADCDLNDRWISRTDSSSCSSILSILSFPRDWYFWKWKNRTFESKVKLSAPNSVIFILFKTIDTVNIGKLS